ncbi:TIGR03364 family FAD-dependent oxidoreductase [Pedobacter sp. MR22-3]|uniref:TIGR03364 family FAD-dependent oxidoreductase n=1 Tax=Pedobacter sp. MR22-3 TaxID=2994552 RepID=UPI0022451688|nr:TIGR03364 family FAD-dependent oxidoreductase [Pedobacter sp. MR22-3]MCX2586095.1 TIGR03364 family FAD-dependent oxidoreductase [Pedobacter sp. MR22-3]
MNQPSAIVIGAGIVGLATARALAIRGFEVTVFERHEHAVGASIRNFGMVWPIGQPTGPLFERAMLSRSIWKQICMEAGIWHDEVGSLHIANSDDELAVMTEYIEMNQAYRNCNLLSPKQTLAKSNGVNPAVLKGALWSGTEMIVEARVAIGKIAGYLEEKYGVNFHWNTAISQVENSTVKSGSRSWQADEIFICSGAEFETLYPEIFMQQGITKCKLQMLRIISQPEGWRMGPALCGSLSMIHYPGFHATPSLSQLRKRYEVEYAEYLKWGIHVMAAQNHTGEITIGDSHEYGLVHDPFDKDFINQLIIKYLKTFTHFKDNSIIQTWNGIYPKMKNGESELVMAVAPGVTIINGLGGNGMTLSFGLCEQVIGARFSSQTL